MSQETVPTLIVAAVILLAFLGMYLGWLGRRRRQAWLDRPLPVPAELGAASSEREVLYVSTTLRDQPLERVAVAGLGIRARARLAIHPEGLVLALQGSEPLFIASGTIWQVGRSTVTIDRVVERDGLVRIAWLLGETPVDTFLRVGTREQTAALVADLAPFDRAASPRASTDPTTSVTSRDEDQ